MNHSSKIAVVDVLHQRSADCILFLDLAGPLRLQDAEGADLTPRSRKAQGLLALIGTSPGLRRSRSWLQDKLWSDRGPEQGAASLRQCLTEIRLALGKQVDYLKTETGWVALDPERVRVRTELPGSEPGEDAEFLEGLDIRDPEFEHWVRDQRMHYSEPTGRNLADAIADRNGAGHRPLALSAAARQTVGSAAPCASPDREPGDEVSGFVLDLVAKSLLGHATVDVMDFRAQPGLGYESAILAETDWLLHATSSILGDRARVTLRLSKFGDLRVLWTDATTFSLAEFYEPEQTAVDAFAARATQFVLEKIQALAVVARVGARVLGVARGSYSSARVAIGETATRAGR